MTQEQTGVSLRSGLMSGTIHFSPSVRERMYQVEIEAMEVSLGDFETYSEALRKSRESGLPEGIAAAHIKSGHTEYQITRLDGTVTLRRYELDERLRAIYSPNAAIVYHVGGNILSAFVVHARKAPEELAA